MDESVMENQVARLRAIVNEIAPCPSSTLSSNTHLVNDLAYDSVSLLELIVAIESEFESQPIAEEDTHRIRTLGQLESLVVGMIER